MKGMLRYGPAMPGGNPGPAAKDICVVVVETQFVLLTRISETIGLSLFLCFNNTIMPASLHWNYVLAISLELSKY